MYFNGNGNSSKCLSFDHSEKTHVKYCSDILNTTPVNATNLLEVSMDCEPIPIPSKNANNNLFSCSRNHGVCGGNIINSTMVDDDSNDLISFGDLMVSNVVQRDTNSNEDLLSIHINSTISNNTGSDQGTINTSQSQISEDSFQSEANRLSSIMTDDDVNLPTIEDLQIIKRYVDSIFHYQDYKSRRINREIKTKALLIEATHKTVAERMNLDSKGIFNNPRLIQIVRRYSSNTIRVSEEANEARELYIKSVNSFEGERVLKTPVADEFTRDAFNRLTASNFQCPVANHIRFNFAKYETARDYENNTLYKAIIESVDSNNK